VLVPIDYRASPAFLLRVAAIVDARAVLVGEAVDAAALADERVVWSISELRPATVASGFSRKEPDGAGHPVASGFSPKEISADTTAEIIFTSGATAEPKGVIITHRNILANIVPIEREMAKYKKWAKPFLPIRFLNLLPLSHMFGQAMATFVPPMLPGVVVFTRSYAPEDIIRQIRQRRVSVLVCVPKMLEVLRDHVLRVAPEAANAPVALHWAKRWWKFRRIHRMFGFKFWAMVVGAAPLDPELEAFWGRLGFLVIQGYGLTETAPIVTLNHPLHAARGAVGKPIAGVEVRIADDGEILVRGDNVTSGYYNAPEETRASFIDGWFHTGDIGELDDIGRIRITDRLKNIIVLGNGKNVSPAPMEAALSTSKYVAQAVILGDRQAYTGALIAPDFEELGSWAAANGLAEMPPEQLVEERAVHRLYDAEVKRTLDGFAIYERPRRIALLPRLLTEEAGELTPSMKTKNRVVLTNWADKVAYLFDEKTAD
jgi:long-chain acyl-CoA synthetase